jgi:hypothetical protein
MIVRDIQVENALIQVDNANKLLAVGSPHPTEVHNKGKRRFPSQWTQGDSNP